MLHPTSLPAIQQQAAVFRQLISYMQYVTHDAQVCINFIVYITLGAQVGINFIVYITHDDHVCISFIL